MQIISCLLLRNRNVSHFNPLTPNSDQRLIPPYNNAPESHIKVISHQVKKILRDMENVHTDVKVQKAKG